MNYTCPEIEHLNHQALSVCLHLVIWASLPFLTSCLSYSHASKVMLKILQARLQQYVNREFPDVQAGLKKAEEPEIKFPTFTGSLKKQESFRKTSISDLLTMPQPLTVWITTNVENS